MSTTTTPSEPSTFRVASLSAAQIFNAVGQTASVVTVTASSLANLAETASLHSQRYLRQTRYELHQSSEDFADAIDSKVSARIAERKAQLAQRLSENPSLVPYYEDALTKIQASREEYIRLYGTL